MLTHCTMARTRSTPRDRFPCPMCRSTFNSKDDCHRHVDEKHHGRRRKACAFCARVVLKRSLKRHLRRCRRARLYIEDYHKNLRIFIADQEETRREGIVTASCFIPPSQTTDEYWLAAHAEGPDPFSFVVFDQIILKINENNGWHDKEIVVESCKH